MDVVIFTDVNGILGFGRYGGAYKVATELRKAGYSVQTVDFFADLTFNELERITEKFIGKETLFVGFATTVMIGKTTGPLSRTERTTVNRYSGHLAQDEEFVREMFGLFRGRNPRLKIVIGGGKAAITSLDGVDFWVWGAADRSIVALADHLSKGTPLITRAGQTAPVISARDYPYQFFSTSKIVWEENDNVFANEHLPIEIDRGCIFRCTFCANQLFKYKGEFAKNPHTLKEEFLDNYERFGTTGYMFCDDTVNDSPEKVMALHEVISSLPFQIEWTGFGRVDVIHRHREQRELLLESGLRALLFGLETLHPVAGKGVGKGLDPEKVKDTLYHLAEKWKGRVTITGSFIVGLPGEPEDSIWETVEWLQRDDCPLDSAVFSPLNIRSTQVDDPDAPLSQIARDPGRFGYTVTGPRPGTGISTEGPYWKNEFMDKTRAVAIVERIQNSRLKVPPIADWIVYSRLRTLGYAHAELITKRASDRDFVIDAAARWQQLRSNYVEQVLL